MSSRTFDSGVLSVQVAFSGTTSFSHDLERDESGYVFFTLMPYLYFTSQCKVRSARMHSLETDVLWSIVKVFGKQFL